MGRGRCHKVYSRRLMTSASAIALQLGLSPKKGGTLEVTSHFVKLFKALSCNKTAKGAAPFVLL